MKVLKTIAIVVVSIVAIYVIICLASNKISSVEVSREMNADVSKVFAAVNDFNHYQNWNEWSKMDPEAHYEVKGSTQVGDQYHWDGETVGTGYLEKVSAQSNKTIKNHMVFKAPFVSEGDDLWSFEEKNGKTFITWTTKTEAPWYTRPVMGFMLSGTMEKGLDNMESYVATMPEPKAQSFEMEKLEEIKYLGIRHKIAAKDLSETIGKSYAKLGQYMNENALQMAGMPIAIYYTWENDSTDMVAAFPVNETVEGNDEIDFGVFNACNALSTMHYGSYESSGESHEAIYAYAEENGLTVQGAAIEIYLNDPEKVAPDALKTKIIYPLSENSTDAM